jgi:predicted permease
MNFIEKIRNKPHAEKIRIIWIVVIIAVVLLIILWALTSRIAKNNPKDTTLFQTIGRGIKDIKENYRK